MDPHFIVYVNPENIEERGRVVSTLMKQGFFPMISAAQPQQRDLQGLEGLIIDSSFVAHLSAEWKGGDIFAIVWYNWDISKKDLRKLVPYFESLVQGEVYIFNYEDRLLVEYTKPAPLTPPYENKIEPEPKKRKV